jgi:hypothetical protein
VAPAAEAGLRRARLLHDVPASFGLAAALPDDVEGLALLRMHHLRSLLRDLRPRERAMLLGAAGVTHVVRWLSPGERDDWESAWLTRVSEIEPAGDARGLVLRNRLVVPRVRLVPRVIVHEAEPGFVEALQEGPDDLFLHATLVSRADAARFLPGSATQRQAPAPWRGEATEEAPGRMRTEGGGGYLIVSEAWTPGIRVRVDGGAGVAFPADHAFTGVVVPPGSHVVEIGCDPWLGEGP